MTKYFTSDTHFAHPFVAALRGYAKTGFTSDNTIKQQANEAAHAGQGLRQLVPA